MQTRTLGTDGPTVSALGLGLMGMSDFYGPAEEAESIATFHHALDRGVTFLDTADMYGVGRNEELVGKAIRDYFASGKAAWDTVRGRPPAVTSPPNSQVADALRAVGEQNDRAGQARSRRGTNRRRQRRGQGRPLPGDAAVADAALVGLAHPHLGEVPAALVQLRAGMVVDEAALRAFAATRLAASKVPVRMVMSHDALPRNANGKLVKGDMRKAFAS